MHLKILAFSTMHFLFFSRGTAFMEVISSNHSIVLKKLVIVKKDLQKKNYNFSHAKKGKEKSWP